MVLYYTILYYVIKLNAVAKAEATLDVDVDTFSTVMVIARPADERSRQLGDRGVAGTCRRSELESMYWMVGPC